MISKKLGSGQLCVVDLFSVMYCVSKSISLLSTMRSIMIRLYISMDLTTSITTVPFIHHPIHGKNFSWLCVLHTGNVLLVSMEYYILRAIPMWNQGYGRKENAYKPRQPPDAC